MLTWLRILPGIRASKITGAVQRVGWPYGLEVRVRAVGLVGVGRPVREVAGLVGVHPATVRRWVRQAAGRWADLADAVDTANEQHTDLDPGAG